MGLLCAFGKPVATDSARQTKNPIWEDDSMKKLVTLFAALALILGLSGTANALVLASDMSEIYGAGGLDVVVPGADPVGTDYTSLADPFAGTITFDNPVEKRVIGDGWATWSHGYTGAVLYSQGMTSIRMDFDRSIYGFGFYAEPNPFSVIDITMGLSIGVTQTKAVDGSGGAAFFGFLDGGVDWVQISCDGTDFAFGEMVMVDSAVPEPTTLLLFGMGTLGLGIIRKYRK
jgi:hypothetical protein